MTLALYGKSKGRQATLVVAALFAILVASVGGLWVAQRVLAHHPTYTVSAQCDGDWDADATYAGGGATRMIVISNVVVNGAAYSPSWSSGADSDTSGIPPGSNGISATRTRSLCSKVSRSPAIDVPTSRTSQPAAASMDALCCSGGYAAGFVHCT